MKEEPNIYIYQINTKSGTTEIEADDIDFSDGLLSVYSGCRIIAQFSHFESWLRKEKNHPLGKVCF